MDYCHNKRAFYHISTLFHMQYQHISLFINTSSITAKLIIFPQNLNTISNHSTGVIIYFDTFSCMRLYQYRDYISALGRGALLHIHIMYGNLHNINVVAIRRRTRYIASLQTGYLHTLSNPLTRLDTSYHHSHSQQGDSNETFQQESSNRSSQQVDSTRRCFHHQH